ncbi:Glycosyltransferase involved in cell wall bisynthesis [Cohaesibacter sp. ES.047]|uniref:glycosyltransferase family 4 protein n=1 Tax=Cohaesibacter sp. ES.047 TaxID=1798205 RepID=UPI000BB809C9|nr:glycosyltransferase family 4 protein [Cohaesibacter sp. ES.047]SNY92762.1 Glycosyltransferase involved in cell wall bisynthesis [Cohaesibacter sp. ES.047]
MNNGNGDVAAEMPRQSLLFFAPECFNTSILDAYDLYLDHLNRSGHFDVTIMAPNGSPFAEKARHNGALMHPVSDFSRKLLQRTPQLWPILTATRRYRFDIALAHDSYGCRGLSQIARRVIGVCHNDQFNGFQSVERVIALTSGASDLGRHILDDAVPVEVLPYPYRQQFDVPVPPAEDDKPLVVGTSGPFVDGDGLGTFIHAAQLLHQSHPDTRFVIVGSGPTEHELKELSDQIAPFIDFTGPLNASEMADLIDLYCLTAPEASYSVPLCEMMDAGVACVATCTNGAMDILKGGMVAPIVPIDDAFSLAVQLQELLDDRPQIKRIKKSCFERIREEDFDPDEFNQRLITLLSEAR